MSEGAFVLERLPHRDNFWVVDEQYCDRHAANLSQSVQLGPVPDKVLHPRITPGIEQPNDGPAIRINPSDVRTLEAVAMYTGEGKILKSGCAPMLPRDDVINLERRRVECRGQLAILTATERALPDPTDEIGVQ